jgi:glycogen debranching enzyme
VTCDPVYPPGQVFPFYYLAGIPYYHRTLIWPWLGTLNAINKSRAGRTDEAAADLARIAAWYISQNVVAEVYEPDGRPVNRRFFQAEFPFAWNAGLFVYAVHACGLADNEGAQAPVFWPV